MAYVFDDGILEVFEVKNIAEPGLKPKESLINKLSSYFGFETVGASRYYQALQVNEQIDLLVRIPEWQDILVTDIVRLNEHKYRVVQAQFVLDDDTQLKITRLSLHRTGEFYDE